MKKLMTFYCVTKAHRTTNHFHTLSIELQVYESRNERCKEDGEPGNRGDFGGRNARLCMFLNQPYNKFCAFAYMPILADYFIVVSVPTDRVFSVFF